MRVQCLNTLGLVLVALVGCRNSSNDLFTKNITIEEAAQIAISEVMSKDNVAEKEKLLATAEPDGNGWFVLVIENSYRQLGWWHMQVSSSGEVSEFCCGN